MADHVSQGEASQAGFKISPNIPITDIPNIMRAMGFHPTEEEIENMVNEVKFSKVDTTGQIVTEIDMEGLVKRKFCLDEHRQHSHYLVYVNHKPINNESALAELAETLDADDLEAFQNALCEYGMLQYFTS